MNKLTILFILGIVCYFTYSKINEFYNILNDLKSSSNTVLAITAVTKDRKKQNIIMMRLSLYMLCVKIIVTSV